MTIGFTPPRAVGQLVWCPNDPAIGIGLVTKLETSRVRVRFLRLQEDRTYTTRSTDLVIARYPISPGERVGDKNGAHVRVVRRLREEDALAIYELEDGREVAEKELVPDVRDIGPKARLATLNLAHPEVVRARMQGLSLATTWPRPSIAGIFGSRVLWLPHQIDIATRAVESARVRLLLADEVGLGKTVEAILIFAGLRHDRRADRVLILTPQALTIQWLGEVFRKAHELFVMLDDERLEDAAVEAPDLSFFEAHQRIIAPIDRVADDPELAASAVRAPWDLVIVDEAHHLRWSPESGGNPAYRLLEGLAAGSQHLLLLTATPMALDPAEYHALMRLLDPTRFDDPKSFETIRQRVEGIRTAAREVEAALAEGRAMSDEARAATREVLADDETDAERLDHFAKLPPTAGERRTAADELLEALRQRHGLADFVVRNRRGPVGGLPERRAQLFPLDPTDAQARLIDVGESVMFELADTISDPRERYQTLGRLLRALWATPRALTDILRPLSPELVEHLAPHVGQVIGAPLDNEGLPTGDARLRWLVRLLRRHQEDKVLVFVETDIAVRALRDALETAIGSDIAVFHRGLTPHDQDRQVAWFRDPEGAPVMLSTEAGGEGRNFQFCNRVVLYDMPWRPATVEQRIGRVDRVGQKRDVHILVPHFKSGFEAAILKVLQEAIDVLDQTVGGIDHALEYVSDRIGELVHTGGDVDAWKALYLETRDLVQNTRERIATSVDPILDHASFSPERVATLLRRLPADLEEKTEAFVRGYADHNHLDLQTKIGPVVWVEGAPGATGGADLDAAYDATFSRTYGLDHEGVEFLSFGHPLVEQAIEWAREADSAGAAVAICRGFATDGAVFIWRFTADLPEDVPEAGAFLHERLFTFAVDEAGNRVADLEDLIDSDRPLDRMDAKPLKQAGQRWRKLVGQNFDDAEKLANTALDHAVDEALERLHDAMASRRRALERQLRRRQAGLKPNAAKRGPLAVEHAEELAAIGAEEERLERALELARPRLMSVLAVRLVKAKLVSG